MNTRRHSTKSETRRAPAKSRGPQHSGPSTHSKTKTAGMLYLQRTHGNHAVSHLLDPQDQIKEEDPTQTNTGLEHHPVDDSLTAGNADGQQLQHAQDGNSRATDPAPATTIRRHANRTPVIQRTPGGLPPEAVKAIKQRRRLYESPEEEEERERAERRRRKRRKRQQRRQRRERRKAFRQLPNPDAVDYVPRVPQGPQPQQNAQQPADKKESKFDKTKDIYGKAQTGVSIGTGIPTTVRLGENTRLAAQHSGSSPAPTVSPGFSATLFGAGALNSTLSTIKGGHDWYKAHKTRKSKDASATEKQQAWKDEKTAAKGVGTGLVGGAGHGAGFASQVGASGAAAAVGPLFGVGFGIEGLRNIWGGGRALYKAGRLQGTKRKLRQSAAQLEAHQQTEQDQFQKAQLGHKLEKTKKLEGLTKFTRNRKLRISGEKGIGLVGAGLGIAGVAAGATPVGWGLLAGSAAVGLGAAAWKGGKGFYKRGKRLNKMRRLRNEMDGKKRGKGWVAKQLFFGGRMSKRRESTEKRYEQLTQNNNLPPDKRDDLAKQLRHSTKTKKQRKAKKLLASMRDPDSDVSGSAKEVGQKLGVMTKDGKVRQGRGWKFWKKRADIDLDDESVKDSDLVELLARKL